jgi:hypothetical protein
LKWRLLGQTLFDAHRARNRQRLLSNSGPLKKNYRG